MIKRLLFTLTAAFVCATASYGQISFTAAGTGLKTFDTAPTIADGWSTTFLGSGAGAYTDSNGLYTAVQNVTASSVNAGFVTTATVPPSIFGSNRWNSALQRLQSRPTGVGGTLLLATLRNDSGADVSKVTISYDMSAMVAADSTINEDPQLYGYKVFYSTTGAAASWNIIPELSQPTTGTFTNRLSAVVNITGLWNAGGTLYILWADDNGPSSDTAPSREGGYTIDNWQVTSPTIGIVITSPVNNASFAAGSPVTISATANSEGPITSVDFKDGSNIIQSDSTAPYSISTTTLSLGSHTLTAVSHDSLGNTHTSPPITITVHPNQPPVITALTNDLAATSMYVGSNLTYTAVATDDGSVTNVDFLVDGVRRWTRTSGPYQFAWCDMTAGAHVLSAIASDDLGAKATNSTSITVTNPPGVGVLLANGQAWKYWDEGVDPGSAWKDIGFNDSGWSNGIAEIGYGDTDANRPEVTISRKIVGTPGDPSAITNATQLFRTHFTVGSLSSFTGLVVRAMIDDGAVVYLNGNEVCRNANIPAGQTFITPASATMADDGVLFNEFNVPVNTVHPGDNLVAVEVHQQSLTSSDISFDLMIWGLAPPAPTLRLTYNAPNFDLSWPGGLPSYCVQSKASLTDAWQDVGGVCHPADASDLPDPVDGRYHMGFDIDSFQSPTQFFRLAPNTGN